jgi:hypothetical protein
VDGERPDDEDVNRDDEQRPDRVVETNRKLAMALSTARMMPTTLALNLLRWVAALRLGTREELVVAKTIARRCWGCRAG